MVKYLHSILSFPFNLFFKKKLPIGNVMDTLGMFNTGYSQMYFIVLGKWITEGSEKW